MLDGPSVTVTERALEECDASTISQDTKSTDIRLLDFIHRHEHTFNGGLVGASWEIPTQNLHSNANAVDTTSNTNTTAQWVKNHFLEIYIWIQVHTPVAP